MIGLFATVAAAAVLSLPPNAQAVHVNSEGWPSRVTAEALAPPAPGERIWWWSDGCAVSLITADGAPACSRGTPLTVRVLDERGKPAPNVRILWGTRPMIDDLADELLPSAVTNESGQVAINAPESGVVFARAASTFAASWWQKLSPGGPNIMRSSVGVPIRARIELPGSSPSHVVMELEPVTLGGSSTVCSRAVAPKNVISVLPVPSSALRWTAWCDNAVPLSRVASADSFPAAIALEQGTRAAGRLRTDDGSPVSDASIESVFAIRGAAHGLRRRVKSDAAGAFTLRGLPAGAVQLAFRKAGFATIVQALNGRSDTNLGEIVMRPARTLVVRVVDRNRKPVPGADVRCDGAHAVADDKGIATIADVPAGEDLALHVRAKNFREATLTAAARDRAATVILTRGVHVSGRLVRGPSRAPAGPGTILVTNNGGRRTVEFARDGIIELGGLDAGTLSLEIRADGAEPYPVAEREVADEQEIALGDVILGEGGVVRGRITASGSGVPVANAAVRLLRRSVAGPTAAYAMRDWIAATSAADGSFSIAGFEPGPQLIVFEAAGYAPRLIAADAGAAAEPLDLGTISLDRGRELVVDCVPASACGTEAKLLYAGLDYPWAAVAAPLESGSARLLPAASGSALLRLVDSGRVVDERVVDISASSDVTRVRIELASVDLVGIVTSAGRPRSEGQFQLERRTGGAHSVPVYIESRTSEGQVASTSWIGDSMDVRTAAVDGTGHFRFDSVEPGNYALRYRLNGSIVTEQAIAVPKAEHFDVTVDVPPGEVTGTVSDEGGTAVGLAVLKIRDAAGSVRTSLADAVGNFTVDGLAAGAVSIEAATHDLEGAADARVEIGRPASVRIVLKKRQKQAAAITVADAAGQPVPRATVFLLDGRVLPAGEATTDASGTATFHLPNAVTACAVVYHPAYGWSWSGPRLFGGDSAECRVTMSAQTGALVVDSSNVAAVDLYAGPGVALGSAFSFLGVPMSLTPAAPLRITGLPAGTYTLRAGASQVSASVTAAKETRVALP